MPLLDIAFLEDVGAGTITLFCMIPPLLFCIYVKWDDHRQAKAAAQHGAGHGHSPEHGGAPAAGHDHH